MCLYLKQYFTALISLNLMHIFFFQPTLAIFSIDIPLRENRHSESVKNKLMLNYAQGFWVVMCSE